MALTKIKLNEVDTKATPVLADGVLMSDSEDDGRVKLVTGTAFEEMIATGDTLATALASKLDEVDTKATPVLADSILISDSEDDGRGKLVTVTAFEEMIATGDTLATALASKQDASNAVTRDGTQSITGQKVFKVPFINQPTSTANYSAFSIGAGTELWWYLQFKPATKELNWYTTKGGLYPVPLSLVYDPDPRAVFPIAPHVTTEAQTDNSLKAASTAFVQASTAGAIYDLPVTRSGLVSDGTDVVLLETGVLDPAWYDITHVLNVSFFARNDSGINNNTTFKVQLYDEGNSTAYTIASITADTMDYRLLQASIYRLLYRSVFVNCNIQYGYVSGSGSVSLTAGAYKLRVVCTSTLSTVFGSAQVRFTK